MIVDVDLDFRPESYFRKEPPPYGLMDGLSHRHDVGSGEDLPDLMPGEVEIARIRYPLNVHQEAVSVRARADGDVIRYRVVDEYGYDIKIKPDASRLPLTLAELIALLDSATGDYDEVGGLVTRWATFIRMKVPIRASYVGW